VVAVAVVVLVAVTIDVAQHGWLTHLDSTIAHHVESWQIGRSSAEGEALRVLTFFGQRGPVLGVATPVALYLAWRSRSVSPLLRYAVALVLLTIAVYALKGAITRPAPSYRPGLDNPAQSFPSGHMVNAILIWGTLAWAASRAEVAAWLVRTLRVVQVIAPPAVFIGMTLLNYHWFSDFVGGACVGVILLPLVLGPWWERVETRIDERWIAHRVSDRPRPDPLVGQLPPSDRS
jgi:membrane-associated phospholipid phosphatase